MAQKRFNELKDRFDIVLNEFMNSAPMKRLAEGGISVEAYRSYVKQVYYYVRENPQLQVLSTVYFRGRHRQMVRNVFKHALSEVGHEQLALNDYITLGGDGKNVPYKNPLPATTALTSFAFHQTYNLNHLGSLGYLFFLEFAPTTAGQAIADHIKAVGVPEEAMSWLIEHIELDHEHNRMMERYAEVLINNDEDLDAIEYAMRTTGYLYSQMIAASIEDAELGERDTGWAWHEVQADAHLRADQDKGIAAA